MIWCAEKLSATRDEVRDDRDVCHFTRHPAETRVLPVARTQPTQSPAAVQVRVLPSCRSAKPYPCSLGSPPVNLRDEGGRPARFTRHHASWTTFRRSASRKSTLRGLYAAAGFLCKRSHAPSIVPLRPARRRVAA